MEEPEKIPNSLNKDIMLRMLGTQGFMTLWEEYKKNRKIGGKGGKGLGRKVPTEFEYTIAAAIKSGKTTKEIGKEYSLIYSKIEYILTKVATYEYMKDAVR